MGLIVVKRPIGHKLGPTGTIASVSGSYGGALFTTAGAHGLTTGNTIFIYSVRGAYNGFWYAQVVDGTSFEIREYGTAPLQDYIGSGDVTYYKSLIDVPWNAVHLPIVYKLKSDKWPINTVDTARTVSSFSNSNGYTQLTLSGDIKASGSADALEQVVISGTASLDGVYKILLWNSDVNFVIDLSYSSTNSFTGGTIQYYYGNYHARIRVYAGLPSSHYWGAYKPYELVAEFSQEPDPDGIVMFNINEFVKKQIGIIENNTLLDTLPNNVNAFTYFKISFAESYDDANQYSTNSLNVSEFVGPYTEDVDLIASNSSLPFKSRDSGFMTPYVSRRGFFLTGGTAEAKWLTTFAQPVLFLGKYFDVSYIMNESFADDGIPAINSIRREVYDANGNLLNTFTDVQTFMHKGIYRYQVERSALLEKRIDITLVGNGGLDLTETLTINVNQDCSPNDFYVTWLNSLGGYDYWNFTAETQYTTDTIESKTQEKNIFPSWPKSFGEFADSRTKQTVRRTKDGVTLNSQYLESEQMDGLALIFESPLVQEMNSIYDRRTIILEGGTFNNKVDNQKLLMVTVKARYTDENPSQAL